MGQRGMKSFSIRLVLERHGHQPSFEAWFTEAHCLGSGQSGMKLELSIFLAGAICLTVRSDAKAHRCLQRIRWEFPKRAAADNAHLLKLTRKNSCCVHIQQ
jgi:hypothetical protein